MKRISESRSNTRTSFVENADSGVTVHAMQEDSKLLSAEPGGRASNKSNKHKKSQVSRSVRNNTKVRGSSGVEIVRNYDSHTS